MDLVDPNKIDKYVEDLILEYLQSQAETADEGMTRAEIDQLIASGRAAADERKKCIADVKELLSDILIDVDKTVIFQDVYDHLRKKHHQYELFDIEHVLPNFKMDNELMQQICFREALLISDADNFVTDSNGLEKPKCVGGLCLNIKSVRGLSSLEPPNTEEDVHQNVELRLQHIKEQLRRSKDEPKEEETEEDKLKCYEEYMQQQIQPEKFVVHLSSDFDHQGQNGGSRIVSWIDKRMHTLEERRTEYLIPEDKESSSEQILYFGLQEGRYYVKHRTTFEKINETKKWYPMYKAKDIVGEGASFILMRYLAITKYEGTFELSTMLINGDMCRNIYECHGPEAAKVNGNTMQISKIYRYIIEECGINHVSSTVLTEYGLIVKHEWDGCPYILHLNPEMETVGKPIPFDAVALKKTWQTNMELASKYLDFKTEAELTMKGYMRDHPEVNQIIGDYVSSLILMRPDQVINFTMDFFQNYQPYMLPFSDDFQDMEEEVRDEGPLFW